MPEPQVMIGVCVVVLILLVITALVSWKLAISYRIKSYEEEIKNYEEKHDLLDVEFAYYIFLKYAVKTKDYRPLFDFSTNGL